MPDNTMDPRPTAHTFLAGRSFYLISSTAIFLSVLVACGMISDALIEHDDWVFILNGWDSRAKLLLQEGRPPVYLWQKISHFFLTPKISLLSFWLLLSAISLAISVRLRLSYMGAVLCLSVVLFSNQVILLSGWPSYSLAGLLVTLIGVVTIGRRPNAWLLGLAAFFYFLAFQFYPAFSYIVFMAVAATSRPERPAILLAHAIAFGLALLLSTLAIFLVNFEVFGIFGVDPASWRDPDHATDFWSFVSNMPKILDGGERVWWQSPLISALFVLGVIYRLSISPRGFLAVAFIGLVPLSVDLTIVGITGVYLPDRHFMWVPFFVSIACYPLFEVLNVPAKIFLVVLIVGTRITVLKEHVLASQPCDRMYGEVASSARENMSGRVLFPGGYSNDRFRLASRLEYSGMNASICSDEDCQRERDDAARGTDSPAGGTLIVRMDRCTDEYRLEVVR
jgi:hypothetical protein